MKYLSLFTGVGGGDLAFQHLLDWRCLGYVEWDKYCQKVIAQRQLDKIFSVAPIYGDVRAFVGDGYAAAYTGMVDVITGGFPCQPFSTANSARRRGSSDSRNMWPATIECIRTIRPQFAFLENVPGLLSSGYFGTILGDLAESGYDARWRVLSAAEMGAPHKRDRLWIVAHATGGKRCFVRRGWTQKNVDWDWIGEKPWEVEPKLDRMVDGVADRTKRFHAIGNGIVPSVAATAWYLLTKDILI